MLLRIVPVAILAVGSLLLAGCGPATLNENKTLTLDTEYGARAIDLPSVSKPQTVNVEFSSSDGEVTVLLFKEEDAKGDNMDIFPGAKALAQKRAKADSFSVEVPANTPTRVVARQAAAAKTDVQIKINNKK